MTFIRIVSFLLLSSVVWDVCVRFYFLQKGMDKKNNLRDLVWQVSILSSGNTPNLMFASDYSATTVVSAQVLSQTVSWQQESSTTHVVSQQESVAQESAHSALLVLPPQDAKDTATIAANMNTNFFIFVFFLN